MKQILLISLLMITLMSCCKYSPPLQKPFIIINKFQTSSDKIKFYYQDRQGIEEFFVDSDKYDVGDTIK